MYKAIEALSDLLGELDVLGILSAVSTSPTARAVSMSPTADAVSMSPTADAVSAIKLGVAFSRTRTRG
jgi:hypothetical protein